MLITLILLLTGFMLLIYGASMLVKGASALARRLGLSDLIIGLTVVAFGTSLPELTVNIFNSAKELNDAVIANVIGSNIFNFLFILGITGLIFPIKVDKPTVAYEVPFSMIISLILLLLINDHLLGNIENKLDISDSVIMLGLFGLFLFYILKSLKNGPKEEIGKNKIWPIHISLLYIILGLGMLVSGGYLITDSAMIIASRLGISEKLMALTILSIGTSLPELATSAVAAYKRNPSIAVGNVVGSNIFNIAFILGISGIIHPVNYDTVMNKDIYALLFGSFLLMTAMFTGGKMKLDRWEAALMFVCYIFYSVYIFYRN